MAIRPQQELEREVRFRTILPDRFRTITFLTRTIFLRRVTVRNVGAHRLAVRKMGSFDGVHFFFTSSTVFLIDPGKFITFLMPATRFSRLLFGSHLGSTARISWLEIEEEDD